MAELARLTVRSFPIRPVDQPRALESFIAAEGRPQAVATTETSRPLLDGSVGE